MRALILVALALSAGGDKSAPDADANISANLATGDIFSNDTTVIDAATNAWGTKVMRVEIKDLSPPPDLTQAMGINRPSLYAAFGNKEQLFARAVDRYSERGTARVADDVGQGAGRLRPSAAPAGGAAPSPNGAIAPPSRSDRPCPRCDHRAGRRPLCAELESRGGDAVRLAADAAAERQCRRTQGQADLR